MSEIKKVTPRDFLKFLAHAKDPNEEIEGYIKHYCSIRGLNELEPVRAERLRKKAAESFIERFNRVGGRFIRVNGEVFGHEHCRDCGELAQLGYFEVYCSDKPGRIILSLESPGKINVGIYRRDVNDCASKLRLPFIFEHFLSGHNIFYGTGNKSGRFVLDEREVRNFLNLDWDKGEKVGIKDF